MATLDFIKAGNTSFWKVLWYLDLSINQSILLSLICTRQGLNLPGRDAQFFAISLQKRVGKLHICRPILILNINDQGIFCQHLYFSVGKQPSKLQEYIRITFKPCSTCESPNLFLKAAQKVKYNVSLLKFTDYSEFQRTANQKKTQKMLNRGLWTLSQVGHQLSRGNNNR